MNGLERKSSRQEPGDANACPAPPLPTLECCTEKNKQDLKNYLNLSNKWTEISIIICQKSCLHRLTG